jgi:predicted SprT family Zn-dependent metalloprotease
MLSIPERYHRRQEARKLALELMALHGLDGWQFDFNKRKRGLGLCCYDSRIIELSIYLVDHNGVEEIRDTILHEIAHALVGPGHGHDEVWKQKCLEIGAKPERCGQAEMPGGRLQALCGCCGQLFSRHRKPKRMKGWFCRACGPERGKLAWQVEGTVVRSRKGRGAPVRRRTG